MSLLRRIEGQRPAGQPAAPAAPGHPPRHRARPPRRRPRDRSLSPSSPARDANRDVRLRLQTKIINNLDPRLDLSDAKAVRSNIEEMFNKFLDEDGTVITRVERQRMLEAILDEILGLRPDPAAAERRHHHRNHGQRARPGLRRAEGQARLTDVTFQNDEHVMRIIERIIAPHRPPHRRVAAHGRRPPPGRLPRQRHHPAAGARTARW